jgi:hypothetical protein
MSQSLIPAKWKFIVEYEDEETQEISGTIGQANSRYECESLIDDDIAYHIICGRVIVNAEAAAVCTKCDGEGKLTSANGDLIVCDACGGHIGPIAKLEAADTRPLGGVCFADRSAAS